MNLVDSHCHISLTNSPVPSDIKKVLFGGIHPKDWYQQIECKKQMPTRIYTSFGLHPWYLSTSQSTKLEEDITLLTKLIPQADAIGETGLDGFGTYNQSLKKQIEFLHLHIDLANEYKKPLVIHCVKAMPALLRVFKQNPPRFGGLVHSFRGSQQDIEALQSLSFYLSVGPNVLKHNLSVLHNISLDWLLLESDSHDQAPNSRVLLEIASLVADSLQVSCDIVIEANYNNFHKLLGVSHGMDADSI